MKVVLVNTSSARIERSLFWTQFTITVFGLVLILADAEGVLAQGSTRRAPVTPKATAPVTPAPAPPPVNLADVTRARIVLRLQQIRNMYFARYRNYFATQPTLYSMYIQRLASLNEYALGVVSNENLARHLSDDLLSQAPQSPGGLAILLEQEHRGVQSIYPPNDPRAQAYSRIAGLHLHYIQRMMKEALASPGEAGLARHRFATMSRAEFARDFTVGLSPQSLNAALAAAPANRIETLGQSQSAQHPNSLYPQTQGQQLPAGQPQRTPPSRDSFSAANPPPTGTRPLLAPQWQGSTGEAEPPEMQNRGSGR